MTLSVYQHWDPLRVCVVGKSYPPEFYSWIQVPHVRTLFENIAIETEEDYQNIIAKLESFGVKILRPMLAEVAAHGDNKYRIKPPPMTPRDSMVMIGSKFYVASWWSQFYEQVRDSSWPLYVTMQQFLCQAPQWQIQEMYDRHNFANIDTTKWFDQRYASIVSYVQQQGNTVQLSGGISGAMVSRIGRDLYFGTEFYDQDMNDWLHTLNREFCDTRNHVVNTGGHLDGTYCPVCPGLIISLRDITSYRDTFPDWEVVWLKNQSWHAVQPFLDLKQKNKGKWWIPGFEYDQAVIDVVETWLTDWVGYVAETVFDVNMLIIDPKNVMVFNYNEQVFNALERYGITPHVVPFRHRYFWDGGIHCVTCDLDRSGYPQDFFPQRSNNGFVYNMGR